MYDPKATLFQLVDGNKQFRIPIYQRAYSWRQEQCSRLLEDVLSISNAAPGTSHFLGSVVYVANEAVKKPRDVLI
jgi:uncharacterized protein with ParB-like and HNH nuclease domain